jgi:hypothetical protein
MSKARTVCTTALRTGSSLRPAARSAKKRSPKSARALAAHLGAGRPQVVDDVVGVPAEPVEGVHVVALHARQGVGGPVVRGAVAPVQLPAPLVGLLERDGGGRSRPANLRDRSAGQPARDQHHGHPHARLGTRSPTNTSPGARRSTLAGRNGPGLAEPVATGRTACPAPCPGAPSRAGRPAPRPRCRWGSRGPPPGGQVVAHAGPLPGPVDPAVEVGGGLEHVERVAALGGHLGLVEGGHAHQHATGRACARRRAAAPGRRRPTTCRSGCCGGRSGRRALHPGVPDHARRRVVAPPGRPGRVEAGSRVR